MYLLSKDGKHIANMDNVLNIYVKDTKVAVNYVNSGGSCIGQYQSDSEARAALAILLQALSMDHNAQMPKEADVKAWMANQKQDKTEVHHYVNGQKTRSHGAS